MTTDTAKIQAFKDALTTPDPLAGDISISRYFELVELIDTMETLPGQPTETERSLDFSAALSWIDEYEADSAMLAEYGYHIEEQPAPLISITGSSTYSDTHPVSGYKRNFSHNHPWTLDAEPGDSKVGSGKGKYNDHYHLTEVDADRNPIAVDPTPWTLSQAHLRRRREGSRRNGHRLTVRKCDPSCGEQPRRKKNAKAFDAAHAFSGSQLARQESWQNR